MGELKSSTDSLVGIFKPLVKIEEFEQRDYPMEEFKDKLNLIVSSLNVLIEDYMEKYSIE